MRRRPIDITPAERLARNDGDRHSSHGLLLMLACCVPMIVVFTLIALKPF